MINVIFVQLCCLAPAVEKTIHSKLFRKFWEGPGYKRADQTYCNIFWDECSQPNQPIQNDSHIFVIWNQFLQILFQYILFLVLPTFEVTFLHPWFLISACPMVGVSYVCVPISVGSYLCVTLYIQGSTLKEHCFRRQILLNFKFA